MAPAKPHGIFQVNENGNDILRWHAESKLQVLVFFDIHRQDNKVDSELKKTGKWFPSKDSQYYLAQVENEGDCHIKPSLTKRVEEIIRNNAAWDIEELTCSYIICTQCKEEKEAIGANFQMRNNKLRTTCRKCRNDAVSNRASKAVEETKAKMDAGEDTFECNGNGGKFETHIAKLSDKCRDRNCCTTCYNSTRKAVYADTVEPGAVTKMREYFKSERVRAMCNHCNTEKDVGDEMVVTVTGRGYKSICLKCNMAKGTYKVSRQRKRDENLEAYLDHNAEIMRAWRENNPYHDERCKEKKRTDPTLKMNQILKCASDRNIPVHHESIDAMTKKLSEPCFYCGFKDPSGYLNGLDRIESSHGYSDINTVPCCYICNLMKFTFSIDSFIAMTKGISNFHDDVPISTTLPSTNFGGVVQSGIEKTKTLEKANIFRQSFNADSEAFCYLCGIPRNALLSTGQQLTVDCIDSKLDYLDDNVMPCCSDCNIAKKDFNVDEFIGHVKRIAYHNPNIDRFTGIGFKESCAAEASDMHIPILPEKRKPIQRIQHARAQPVQVIDIRNEKIVANFISIADLERTLAIANFRTLRRNSNIIRKYWDFSYVTDKTIVSTNFDSTFVEEFKSKSHAHASSHRQGKGKGVRLVKNDDGSTHDFASISAAARAIDVSESAIRTSTTLNVGGYSVQFL